MWLTVVIHQFRIIEAATSLLLPVVFIHIELSFHLCEVSGCNKEICVGQGVGQSYSVRCVTVLLFFSFSLHTWVVLKF